MYNKTKMFVYKYFFFFQSWIHLPTYWHNNKKLKQAAETADSPLDMYWRMNVWMMHKSVSCTEEKHGCLHQTFTSQSAANT